MLRCDENRRRGRWFAPPAAAVGCLPAVVLAALAAAPTLCTAADAASINYLGLRYEAPIPLSLLEQPRPDEGVLGARLSLRDGNLTAGLMGKQLSLGEIRAERREVLMGAVARLLTEGERLLIADLEAEELLAVADLVGPTNAMIFNIRASDDSLRNADCRANVFHLVPSRAMRADALAQYLLWKKWRRWLLISGKEAQDQAYSQAVRRAAKRYSAKIVDEREYRLETGARRVETGYQQIQTQMPMLTRNAPDHDVIVVADERESFGLYLPYRSARPRPVVGTYGLTAAAWHRSYEQYGGMALQSSFDEFALRHMTERDYLAWLAVKLITDALLRAPASDIDSLRAYIIDPSYKLAGYKGRPMSFRPWNHQLRQPVLVHGERALVTVAPVEGFLHPLHETDTLGYDAPDSTCRFNDSTES